MHGSSVGSNSLQPPGLQHARLLCSWGFSRQEYWSALPFPPPGDLPDRGIELASPTLRGRKGLDKHSEWGRKGRQQWTDEKAPECGAVKVKGEGPETGGVHGIRGLWEVDEGLQYQCSLDLASRGPLDDQSKYSMQNKMVGNWEDSIVETKKEIMS